MSWALPDIRYRSAKTGELIAWFHANTLQSLSSDGVVELLPHHPWQFDRHPADAT